ncbi:MAG: hypothetical protein H0U13_14715, partial [Gemmatimonadaceae bacterium]|nr:hypothetical protein [Gemmatimonadaceae bacterium]
MHRRWVIMVVLAGVTILVYARVFFNEFVSYDDPEYVTRNARVQDGLTLANVAWAGQTTYFSNWHPLTWLTHMAACDAFGLNPAGHHAIDLVLHTGNALLLFLLLQGMTGAVWRSALVAALFAWHPLHVESVAWVSARKDTLSTFFLLLTIISYVRYTRSARGGPRVAWYAITLAVFALGLMSKSMLVTLPFALLLLDYWPLCRWDGALGAWRRRQFIVEKLPLFAMSLGTLTVTFVAQRAGPAMSFNEQLSFAARLANASNTLVAYLGKAVLPTHLAVFYPHPSLTGAGIPAWKVLLATTILIAISAAVIRLAPAKPYLVVGWFWYLGTLVPVIG